MRSARRTLGLTILLSSILSASAAQACPNCREAVESQTGEGARMKDGYYYSILFMVAMPFSLLGVGSVLVTRAVRKGLLPEM